MQSLALIDSPFGFVSMCEAVHAGIIDPPDRVVMRRTVPAGLIELARPLIGGHIAQAGGRAGVLHAARRADVLIVGDPFAGMAQSAVATARHRRVVLLEDGAASLHLARQLMADAPLVRAHQRSWLRVVLARTARRTLLTGGAEVIVVTGLLGTDELTGAGPLRVQRHDFDWSRHVLVPARTPLPTAGPVTHVVVGSALASDGHIALDAYLEWLGAALGSGPVTFLAHRREPRRAVEMVRDRGLPPSTGGGLPAELELRDVTGTLVVDSLPSTTALTIPRVRRPGTTHVRCTRVPDEGWGAATPRPMRDLLAEIATRASAPVSDRSPASLATVE